MYMEEKLPVPEAFQKPDFKQKLDQLKLWISTHKLYAGIIGFIALIIALFILQGLFFSLRANYIVSNNKQVQEKLKQESEKEYQELLEKQAKTRIKSNTELSTTRKALGKQTIHYILVKPESLSENQILPLVKKLQYPNAQLYKDCSLGSDCPKNISLYYIDTFYKTQAKEHGVSDLDLEIKVEGVYDLPSLEKVGDIAYIWGKDSFGTVKLADSFEKVITENDLNIPEKDLVVFLYFDQSFGQDSSGDGRFYEHKAFRSFANDKTGRAYVNVYSFEPEFAQIVVEVAAHETLHLFNATDKYEESESVDRICSIRGRGEFGKTADIMCMYIEEPNDKFRRGYLTEETLVINKETAEEIGWIQD